MEHSEQLPINLTLVYQIVFTCVCPILALIPITLHLFNAYIFSNIEFKTQTYRYLKLNAIIDIISLILVLPLPVTELCSEWWSNNYWLVVYRLYINYYLVRVLRTVSTITSVLVAWDRYRTMDGKKIYGNLFYLGFSINCLFSFIIHLPNLFLNEIVLRGNLTQQQNETYVIKVIAIDSLSKVIISQSIFMTIILIVAVFLNIKLVLMIKKKINLKFKPIKIDEQQQVIEQRKDKTSIDSNSSVQLMEISTNFNAYKMIFSKSKAKELETSLLIFWITVAFIIDQFLQILGGIMIMFINRDSKDYILVFILFYFFIILTHSGNYFIYYNFNISFSRRSKLLFKRFC
jgi:hypothetical protein